MLVPEAVNPEPPLVVSLDARFGAACRWSAGPLPGPVTHEAPQMQAAFQYLSDAYRAEPWSVEATQQLHDSVLLTAKVGFNQGSCHAGHGRAAFVRCCSTLACRSGSGGAEAAVFTM